MTLSKKTIPATLYRNIKRDIIFLELPPGKSITEDELCKHYEVSRTPIRQVIQTLTLERFIIYKRGNGNLIAPMTWDDYLHVYQIRLSLEKLSIQLAVLYATKDDIEAIEENINRQKSIENNEDYVVNFLELDREFHLLIAKAGRNDRLYYLLTNIYDHFARYDILSGFVGRLHFAINDHMDIFKVLKERNSALATSYMERHLESINSVLSYDLPVKLQ